MTMAPWRRRKGKKDAQLANSLRAHVETMWAIACTLTGDEVIAIEVVKEVIRGTLPQPYRSRQRGLRLEVVIATTEAGAARAFSPLDHRVRSRAYAAALSPQASALRRAFSRRVSWDVQAPLWATEVEELAESDVADRLGQTHAGIEAGRVALRLAYIDLRRDLDVNCRETLRSVFGSSPGPEKRAEESHLGSCALCQAETSWLTDLGSALRSLPPVMSPKVWEEARQLALGATRGPSHDPPGSDGAAPIGDADSAPPWLTTMDPRTMAVVALSTADQARPPGGDGCAPAHGSEPAALTRRAGQAHKVVDHVVHP